MTKHQDFHLVGVIATHHHDHQLQDLPHDQVSQGQDHDQQHERQPRGVAAQTRTSRPTTGFLNGTGIFSYAVATFAVCLAARRTAALPRWVAVSGMVAAVLLLASFVVAPAVLLPTWAIIA